MAVDAVASPKMDRSPSVDLRSLTFEERRHQRCMFQACRADDHTPARLRSPSVPMHAGDPEQALNRAARCPSSHHMLAAHYGLAPGAPVRTVAFNPLMAASQSQGEPEAMGAPA